MVKKATQCSVDDYLVYKASHVYFSDDKAGYLAHILSYDNLS